MQLIIQQTVKSIATCLVAALLSVSAIAADRVEGRVEGGGRPVAKANVTLWVAEPGAPQKLADTQTTTLSKLNTLGNLLSAPITAMPGACDKFFEAATPPGGDGAVVFFGLAKPVRTPLIGPVQAQ